MSVIKWDLDRESLIDAAVLLESAVRTPTGAISVRTGACTGRSPNAKSLVMDSLTANSVDWNHNISVSSDEFNNAKIRILDYLSTRTQYKQRLFAGHDPAHRIKLIVTTEFAWQALFANNMFIKPTDYELTIFDKPEWQLYCAPSESDSPCVMVNFTSKEILITGTHYAGEIKKSVFTVLNFLLPEKTILPMHCSVNVSHNHDNPAIFFGLSGTGKTTLSSDEKRLLIGDDEHGWSDAGLFNFEGGCYAKVINLSQKSEPQIWKACQEEGSILENVILGNDGKPDFDDGSLTENTRSSYDLSLIENASKEGRCGHPKNVIFLTCDAFGVLPPVSKLSPQSAADHFVMGYTAKVAGTEAGVTEPQATFSHCFGAPFMPLPPEDYAVLLRKKIEEHNVDCWLVNTGWSGGAYGVGNRMPIEVSREIVNEIVDGTMSKREYITHSYTGLDIPVVEDGLLSKFVTPELTWSSKDDYVSAAKHLIKLFSEKKRDLGL